MPGGHLPDRRVGAPAVGAPGGRPAPGHPRGDGARRRGAWAARPPWCDRSSPSRAGAPGGWAAAVAGGPSGGAGRRRLMRGRRARGERARHPGDRADDAGGGVRAPTSGSASASHAVPGVVALGWRDDMTALVAAADVRGPERGRHDLAGVAGRRHADAHLPADPRPRDHQRAALDAAGLVPWVPDASSSTSP